MKWSDYTKSERIGLLTLAIAIIIGITIWQVLYHLGSSKSIIQNDQLESEWQEFQDKNITWKESNETQDDRNYNNKSYGNENWKSDEELKSIEYHPQNFDPNSSSIEQMIAAGVPISSAKRIIAYRNKKGTFYKKEKLRDFGLTESEYQKLAPYIQISDQISDKRNYNTDYNRNEYNNYSPEPEPTSLSINSASQEDLMKFRGIGPGYSKRIINYRDKLGGFHSVAQVKEVYGLPDSTYQHIKDKLVVNSDQIKKIRINEASEEELAAHPYIGKFMAGNIIKLRNDIKVFKNISDLRQVPLINEEKYRKIVPYIQL